MFFDKGIKITGVFGRFFAYGLNVLVYLFCSYYLCMENVSAHFQCKLEVANVILQVPTSRVGTTYIQPKFALLLQKSGCVYTQGAF